MLSTPLLRRNWCFTSSTKQNLLDHELVWALFSHLPSWRCIITALVMPQILSTFCNSEILFNPLHGKTHDNQCQQCVSHPAPNLHGEFHQGSRDQLFVPTFQNGVALSLLTWCGFFAIAQGRIICVIRLESALRMSKTTSTWRTRC